MPVFKVHYFIIKPTAVPVFTGTSGTVLRLTRGAGPAADLQRQVVIGLYEQYLTQLFRSSLPPGWTAEVNRLQPTTGPAPTPNYTGLTIHNREPIVYWVGENTSLSPSDPTDRRPSLILIDDLEHGHFQEFEPEHTAPARNFIQRVSGADPGGRALAFSFAPLIAEVFSQSSSARIAFGDVSPAPPGEPPSQGWQRHQARLLANASFHEIAHGKCEWVNRPSPSGHPWSAAIGGSIHDHPGAGLLLSSVGYGTRISSGDQSLMRSHALCPMPYYRLGVAAAGQCYREGSAYTPTPR